MSDEIKIGDRVTFRGNGNHKVGVVEELANDLVCVRYNENYVAWYWTGRVVKVPHE